MKLFGALMAAAAGILAYQLFIPPIIGLSDQGDFVRTIGRFGYGPLHERSLQYSYVEPKYVPNPKYRSPYWEQANSEYIFVAAALLLNTLISKDGALDITVVGFVHLLGFLAAFGRLLWVTRQNHGRVLLWIGAVVALTDTGYAAYWNSLYTEPAACIFFLLLLAETVEIAGAGQANQANILRWSLWSFLFVFSRPEYAPIALILALFSFRLATWTRSRWERVTAVVGACALFGCLVYSFLGWPAVTRMAATYNMIFAAIVPESKDAEADLRSLGLDPRLAKYSGTGAWSSTTAFPQLAVSGVLERNAATFAVQRFYLLRPARMWRHLHVLLSKVTSLRLDGYGNFEPSAGLPPRTLSRAFGLWRGFHERVLAPCSKEVVFALCAWPLISAWMWVHEPTAVGRRRIELLALLPVCCLVVLLTATFGDAFDLVRHLFLFNLLLDACVLYLATAVMATAITQGRKMKRIFCA